LVKGYAAYERSPDTQVAAYISWKHLDQVKKLKRHGLPIGVQSLDPDDVEGSITRAVEAGVTHVLIGHSDTRLANGTDKPRTLTDEDINRMLRIVLEDGRLAPTVCFGETEKEKDAGQGDTIIKDSITIALKGIRPSDFSKVRFCYEPVWAITSTPGAVGINEKIAGEKIALVNSILRELGVPTLGMYGGGVNSEKNVDGLLKSGAIIDGCLVGGASHDIPNFGGIITMSGGFVRRTGTGPRPGSYQAEISGKLGNRLLSGKECPVTGARWEGGKLKLTPQALPYLEKAFNKRQIEILAEGVKIPGVRTGTGPVKGSFMERTFGRGRRQIAGEECPIPGGRWEGDSLILPPQALQNIEDGNIPGVRTGAGPVAGSYMRQVFGMGRRQMAGEECPIPGGRWEGDNLILSPQALQNIEDGNIPGMRTGAGPAAGSYMRQVFGMGGRQMAGEECPIPGGRWEGDSLVLPPEALQNIEEGNIPGVRTGAGPAERSYMRQVFGIGRRQIAGEECPIPGGRWEGDSLILPPQALQNIEDGNIPGMRTGAGPAARSYMRQVFGIGRRQMAGEECPFPGATVKEGTWTITEEALPVIEEAITNWHRVQEQEAVDIVQPDNIFAMSAKRLSGTDITPAEHVGEDGLSGLNSIISSIFELGRAEEIDFTNRMDDIKRIMARVNHNIEAKNQQIEKINQEEGRNIPLLTLLEESDLERLVVWKLDGMVRGQEFIDIPKPDIYLHHGGGKNGEEMAVYIDREAYEAYTKKLFMFPENSIEEAIVHEMVEEKNRGKGFTEKLFEDIAPTVNIHSHLVGTHNARLRRQQETEEFNHIRLIDAELLFKAQTAVTFNFRNIVTSEQKNGKKVGIVSRNMARTKKDILGILKYLEVKEREVEIFVEDDSTDGDLLTQITAKFKEDSRKFRFGAVVEVGNSDLKDYFEAHFEEYQVLTVEMDKNAKLPQVPDVASFRDTPIQRIMGAPTLRYALLVIDQQIERIDQGIMPNTPDNYKVSLPEQIRYTFNKKAAEGFAELKRTEAIRIAA